MDIPNSSQRERLDSLWSYVVSDNMKQKLLKDNVVPQQFLDDESIRLVPHVFKNVRDFNWGSSVEPPAPDMTLPLVLFTPFKSLKDHPIKLDAMDPISREAATTFIEYGSPNLSGYVSKSPCSCSTYISRHIQKWAEGGQIRRKVPREVLDLTEFRGIKPVHKYHGLLADYGYDDPWRDGWDTMIYEYDKEHFGTILPHVILLTAQYNKGYNGSMLRGELAAILTAMRNRANQTVNHEEEQQQEEEEPEEAKKKSELMFKNEDRFPVLMVSCVAPHHARIYYACMDEDELVIRQSKIYSFEKKDTALWDLFASILLSGPAGQPDVITERQRGQRTLAMNIFDRPMDFRPPPAQPPTDEPGSRKGDEKGKKKFFGFGK